MLLVGGLVLILLVGSFAGYLYYEANRINHIKVNGLSASTASAQGTENILLVGSTDPARQGAERRLRAVLAGRDGDQLRRRDDPPPRLEHLADLAAVDPPRHLRPERPLGRRQQDRRRPLRGPQPAGGRHHEDFGIPIQHFVELNFETFANVVDALGGVKMYFPMPVFDAYSGLNQVARTGCIQLNGTQALQVVRARHLVYRQYGSQGTNPANWTPENRATWPGSAATTSSSGSWRRP